MANELDEILQSFVNSSREDLYTVAAHAMSIVLPYFTENCNNEDKAAQLLAGFIFTVVAVDGKLSKDELQFIKDVFQSFSEEELVNMVKAHRNEEMVNFFDEVVDNMPANIKSELLNLCTATIAVDHNINNVEYSYLIKLIK